MKRSSKYLSFKLSEFSALALQQVLWTIPYTSARSTWWHPRSGRNTWRLETKMTFCVVTKSSWSERFKSLSQRKAFALYLISKSAGVALSNFEEAFLEWSACGIDLFFAYSLTLSQGYLALAYTSLHVPSLQVHSFSSFLGVLFCFCFGDRVSCSCLQTWYETNVGLKLLSLLFLSPDFLLEL